MFFVVFFLLQVLLLRATAAQFRGGDVRLVGGSYQWEGRVEVFFNRSWGTITDSDWTSEDAQAVCRTMGYFRPGSLKYTGAYFGQGSGPIRFDHIVCSGMEYNLTDCETGTGTRQSSHDEDVGVKCNTIDDNYRNWVWGELGHRATLQQLVWLPLARLDQYRQHRVEWMTSQPRGPLTNTAAMERGMRISLTVSTLPATLTIPVVPARRAA
jgi:hypothetical protein